MVPPLSLDVTAGQSLVLPCEVSSDSSLNPKFKWFFNGKAIDFSKQEHFEMIGKVLILEGSRATLASGGGGLQTGCQRQWLHKHIYAVCQITLSDAAFGSPST